MHKKVLNNSNGSRDNVIRIAQEDLGVINDKFIELMKSRGIKTVRITSAGNSIATGYSANSPIIPLLFRNPDLVEKAKNAGVKVEFFSYARAQDNREEHVFEWFLKNLTQAEINKMVQFDFASDSPKAMDHRTITKEEVNKYYPIYIPNDIGFRDLMYSNLVKDDVTGKTVVNPEMANILVYNGITASFLDDVTRNGEKSLKGFKEDLESLNSFLETIYLTDPYTQIYVCGMPYVGNTDVTIKIIGTINEMIRETCSKYSNCVFVQSVGQNALYKYDGRYVIDIHYNKEEYLYLLANIFNAFCHKYVSVVALNDFHLSMKTMSKQNEFLDVPKTSEQLEQEFLSYMTQFLSKYDLSSGQINRIMEYYVRRYSHDYFHTPRSVVIQELDGAIKKGR